MPEIPPSVCIEQSIHFVLTVLRKIHDGAHKPKGRFYVEYGLVQNTFPNIIDGHFHLIIDLMDAFAYSSDRPNLIKLYHDKLRAGGRAYICVDGCQDIVTLTDPKSWRQFRDLIKRNKGKWVTLPQYLSRKYLTTFSLYCNRMKIDPLTDGAIWEHLGSKSNVLVITRGKKKFPKDFLNHLTPGQLWIHDQGFGMIAPIIEYTETFSTKN